MNASTGLTPRARRRRRPASPRGRSRSGPGRRRSTKSIVGIERRAARRRPRRSARRAAPGRAARRASRPAQRAQLAPRRRAGRTACGWRARTGCRCREPWSAGAPCAPAAFSSFAKLDHRAVEVGPPVGLRAARSVTGRPEAPADLAHQRHLGPGVVELVGVALAEPMRALSNTPRARGGPAPRRWPAARRAWPRCPAPGGRRARGAATCATWRTRARRRRSPRRPARTWRRCRRRWPGPPIEAALAHRVRRAPRSGRPCRRR